MATVTGYGVAERRWTAQYASVRRSATAKRLDERQRSAIRHVADERQVLAMLIVVLKQGRLLNSMRQNRSLGLDPLSASLCPSPSRPTSDATDILPSPSDVKPTMAPWFAFFEVCATYNAETPQLRLTNTTGMGCCQSMPLHHTQTLPSLITASAHPQPFLQPSRPQSIPQDQQIA